MILYINNRNQEILHNYQVSHLFTFVPEIFYMTLEISLNFVDGISWPPGLVGLMDLSKFLLFLYHRLTAEKGVHQFRYLLLMNTYCCLLVHVCISV